MPFIQTLINFSKKGKSHQIINDYLPIIFSIELHMVRNSPNHILWIRIGLLWTMTQRTISRVLLNSLIVTLQKAAILWCSRILSFWKPCFWIFCNQHKDMLSQHHSFCSAVASSRELVEYQTDMGRDQNPTWWKSWPWSSQLLVSLLLPSQILSFSFVPESWRQIQLLWVTVKRTFACHLIISLVIQLKWQSVAHRKHQSNAWQIKRQFSSTQNKYAQT